MRPWLILLLLAACQPDLRPQFVQCELEITLDPDVASPGEAIAAVGRPMSEQVDTEVRVGGVVAPIVEVSVDAGACQPCEACRARRGCTTCQRCLSCADDCDPCEPATVFEVPDLPPGEHPVTLLNRYGNSLPMPLIVTAADEASEPE
ncbi:MAG: hypothetical protein EA397_06180 [Deltaproteobacteria bacterium]|nr:MAG: hypothetical protein EA397_06180 [Deltaproteobacteria bacterium]